METVANTKAANVAALIEQSKYQEAGDMALSVTGCGIVAELSDTKKAPFAGNEKGYRPHWSITLSGPGGVYTFDYFASLNDGAATTKAKEWNKEPAKPYGTNSAGRAWRQAKVEVPKPPTPTAYDIVACLTKYEVGSFVEFCQEFGYDEDSRTDERTWIAVRNEADNVLRVVTEEGLIVWREVA